ncbi:MAG TPA: transposase [Bacteroidales bacterium]|nr:transposase [Bacteroidales bacterium]
MQSQHLYHDQRWEARPHEQVVETLVSAVFGREFNLYGYRLITEELKAMGFIINHKKAYRLMKDNGFLLGRVLPGRMPRQWVNGEPLKMPSRWNTYAWISNMFTFMEQSAMLTCLP